jgi:protein tyrosine/serine phosphatase
MVAGVIGMTCASYAAYCGILIWRGNIHVVEDGQFYRSAQLSRQEFANEIEAYHIRSVLNLRGANPGQSWYEDELAVTRAHDASHYDVGISAEDTVPGDKIEQIIAVLRHAPKPLLVHCRSGADRTGLVAALYRYVILWQSAATAEQELALRYGHFPYLTSKTGAMDQSARAYFDLHQQVPATP